MAHSNLLFSLVAALVVAFAGGFLAARLRLPPIVGYLLAGVAIGPFTPGFTADPDVAAELAEIGIVLLMFGVGIHFSLRDLLAVRGIAVPGAVGQIAVATTLGATVALLWGWTPGEAIVLGLAVSVASTVVLLRALEDRGALNSVQGHVAIGWLIVQDTFTVLVLVLLPALAVPLGGEAPDGSGGDALATLGLALLKAVAFVAVMLFVGIRAIPWLLVQVARLGSRELFTLAVLAIALGVALGSSELFGVSLALGAFLAGALVSESDLSHQAAADALPMRDAFAVLFFVSVGMLFEPRTLLEMPLQVLAILAIVVLGSPAAAFSIVAALGYPIRVGLTVAAGLAQIGEFSFILAGLGHTLDLLPAEGTNIVLAGALVSITLNSLVFGAIDPIEGWLRGRPKLLALLTRRALTQATIGADVSSDLRGHAVICGHGRVGEVVTEVLRRRGFRVLVIDQNRRVVEALRARGIATLSGDAAHPAILEHAHLKTARLLVVTIPDPPAVRRIVECARAANPRLDVIARTHSDAERAVLTDLGAGEAVYGEWETALELTRRALHRFGVTAQETRGIIQRLRVQGTPALDDERPA
jgi:CPA2 family monovalent cation:H+ antiporter-2